MLAEPVLKVEITILEDLVAIDIDLNLRVPKTMTVPNTTFENYNVLNTGRQLEIHAFI